MPRSYTIFLLIFSILLCGCKPPTTNRVSLSYTPENKKDYAPPTSGTCIYYIPMYFGKYWKDISAGLALAQRKLAQKHTGLNLLNRYPDTQSFAKIGYSASEINKLSLRELVL